MLKALFKRQFAETASFFFLDKKNEKKRSALAIFGLGALILYAVFAVGATFWLIAQALCAPLVQSGLAWVYFAVMGTIAFAIACIMSVFTAKSSLYEAKDNELLLSMPVPAWAILFTRMTGQYFAVLFFTAVAFLPAAVCYFAIAGVTFLSVFFCILITLIIPLGALTVGCLVGWLIAWLTARLPAKNLITCVFLIAFFILYSLGYSALQDGLNYLIANGGAVAESIQTTLFPLWKMGLAATGDPLAMLVFTGIFGGGFALVYLLLSLTFFRIVTMKRGQRKARYTEKDRKSASVFFALLRKESARLFKNPMILFNCGLGSVLALILGVFALFNTALCEQIVASGVGVDEIAVILAAILCFIASSNIITASSISLEGESLWVLRSMPVSTNDIFGAKIAFHVLFTAIPTGLCTGILCALLRIPVLTAVCTALAVIAITLLCAAMGLSINLKLPNLKWKSEIVAVKQGLSTLIAMFAGWGISALFIGGYFLFGIYLPATAYLLIASTAFLIAALCILLLLKKRGVSRFENL